MTVATLLNLMIFEPHHFIPKIAPTPLLMMIISEHDSTTSSDSQLEAYRQAREPKTLKVLQDTGHFEIYFRDKSKEHVDAQLKNLKNLFA